VIRQRTTIWAAVTIGTLVFASCGSDAKTSSTAAPTTPGAAATTPAADTTPTADTTADATATTATGDTTPSTPTPGVSDTAIKVGGVQVVNGQGYSYADMCKGAQVVFDKVNDTGGVNGRTIDYVGCRDDTGVSDTDTAETQRLVEQDKVFAIVPASVIFSGSEVASKANTPYFGWGISPYYCDNAQGFGFNGCTGPKDPNWTNPAYAQLGKKVVPGAKTIGHISHDIPPGIVNAAAAKRGYAAEGLELVYDDETLPLTGTSDYTPYVQKILAANPDIMVIQIQTPVPLITALRAAGYKGATLDAVSYNPNLLKDAAIAQAMEGSYVVTAITPFESTDIPGVKTLLDDVAKYGAKDQQVNLQFAMGYYSALMFIDMATKAGKNLSYDSFYKVANDSGYCFNADGGLGNVCYPKGHTDSNGCYALVQIQQGAFVPKEPMGCSSGIGTMAGTPG
jgi:ABC-type branched-subunit amino acid transport system substrate-binding protein